MYPSISKCTHRERSGSVVECLTRDRRAAGSSLTGVTALWSLSKTHLSLLSTGSTQEDPSRITERLLSGRKESNQTNKIKKVNARLHPFDLWDNTVAQCTTIHNRYIMIFLHAICVYILCIGYHLGKFPN